LYYTTSINYSEGLIEVIQVSIFPTTYLEYLCIVHPSEQQNNQSGFLFFLPCIFLLKSKAVCFHYRKDGLCLAPNDLPGAFYRAHGKDHSLPCAYDTPHGYNKRTVQTSLSCVIPRVHGKDTSLPCVGPARTAKRPGHVRRLWHGGRLGRTLTVVSLCRAPYMKRTSQIYL
jgi:hypothetical protein